MKLHTRAFSLLKETEVQLKRLGGSQPLCSSQCRMAVPEKEERESERVEEQTAAERDGLRRVSYIAIIIW